MTSPDAEFVTQLLQRINEGDSEAPGDLLPLVYDHLRELAGRAFGGEPRGGQMAHTLQATALVHEAYIKLLGPSEGRSQWESRRHFFAVAATAMRRVLADHARRSGSLKRGGAFQRVTLDEQVNGAGGGPSLNVDLVDLNDALEALEAVNPRLARVVELRFFSGLTTAEVAAELGLTERMVFKDWRAGRAVLAERFRAGS